ncbi:hypothetical protein Hanom_Chr01g00056031 [Helianthus anomalus]
MKPPKRNMSRSARVPPVFAMFIVLHTPAISLKSPPPTFWIKKTNKKCLKNLYTK